MVGTGTVWSGAILRLGRQGGQRLAEALETLDAQLRTDIEVLGEMSGAVLQGAPAADDHVVELLRLFGSSFLAEAGWGWGS